MIQVENIVKSYGKLTVLKGITAEIPDKKVVAIVGPSGAGKTTLLQIMGTLSQPDSGSVIINGDNVSLLGDKQMARFRNSHIGFVFQFHHLLPEFTALENVCMPALIAGKSMGVSQSRAKELLNFLGLSYRLSHKPAELSGGEQQRVAVARALVNNPLVVLADEPSGNLDSRNREELHKLFFTLRDQMGQTFVVVTHDKELAQMADLQISMNDGNIE
ncbi:MAG: ABC transporter ATP-binding protein [Bacteroidales bacterium]